MLHLHSHLLAWEINSGDISYEMVFSPHFKQLYPGVMFEPQMVIQQLVTRGMARQANRAGQIKCYTWDRHRVQLGVVECEGGSVDAYLATAV